MGKKIARGFGYGVSAILFLLCVTMIALSAMFGSEGLVGAFGYNLYLCEVSKFEGLNSGAAVVVEQCEPYDITEGNLILFSAAAADEKMQPALGYTESITMSDGVYSIGITDGDGKAAVVSESDFIGKAGWSSDVLGAFIRFSLTPMGVLIMAVLPCVAVVIFSILKAYADSRPLPEVAPQVKNSDTQAPISSGLAVKPDGKAVYGRPSGAKAPTTADNVLFTQPRRNPVSKPAPAKPAAKPQQTSAPMAKPAPKPEEQPKPAAKPAVSPAAGAPKKEEAPKSNGGVPSSVATKRYLDNAVSPAKKVGDTAELPAIPKKKNDAFFSQSGAPQIGKNNAKRNAVIDLEDALATAGSRDVVKSATGRTKRSDSRRSADILAAKNRDALISDDEETRDRSRYDIDTILSGLDKRR